MADQKITALTSLAQADIVSGTDVLPIVDVGSPSVTKKATPQAVVGASVNDLAQTWNAGGTTFTAVKMNVTDTASAAGSLLIDLQTGGTSQFSVSKVGRATLPSITLAGNLSQAAWTTTGIGIAHTARTLTDTSSSGTVALAYTNVLGGNTIAASSSTTFTNYATLQLGAPAAGTNVVLTNSFSLVTAGNIGVGGTDVILARDAADALAQRNGTNAQAFRVYNTFTDASNYERGFFRFNSSVLRIGFEAAGTGSTRAMQLMSVGFAFLGINDTNGIWNINGSGHFVAGTDNSVDIGASGANRPRNLYMASWIRMAVTTVAALPAAATAGAGARMMVSDALGPTFGSAVVGGGAVTVPVYSTGAAWNVG